jgi:hypothetical protein
LPFLFLHFGKFSPKTNADQELPVPGFFLKPQRTGDFHERQKSRTSGFLGSKFGVFKILIPWLYIRASFSIF